MTRDRVKEISYYLFFGLMIFAKGIGLDSGDTLYYILSIAACACVGCKLILTKYNIKQMAAMILLCLIAFVAYRNSGRMGIVLTVLTIIGIKDISINKLFKLGAVVYGISFAGTVFMAAAGIIENPLVVHEKAGIGEVIRWGMGYSTGNIFHVSYFILVIFLCYVWGRRYSIKRMLLLMTGNLLVFLFSLSYTGVAVTAFYLLINIYAVKRIKVSKAEKILYQVPLPCCVLFSLIAPFMLKYPLVQKLDSMLQARLSFSGYYLQNQPITLWGTRMQDVPNFWIIMDNGYVYFLMTFGIVAFALFVAGYAILIARYSGWGKYQPQLPKLAIIYAFLLYGIMEQFISNAAMNISLIFVGEILFGEKNLQEEGICSECEKYFAVIRNRWKNILGAGIFAGIGMLACHLIFTDIPEAVKVPLRSLNYVNSQSAIIHTSSGEGTKEELKEIMGEYQVILRDEEFLDAVLGSSEHFEGITADQIRAAMEFSLPQYVQNSREYGDFRIRLLEIYWDIPREIYAELFNCMLEMSAEEAKALGVASDSIYSEQIGKSFGQDRIEHLSGENTYVVEKSGMIAKIEYYRSCILACILGGIGGIALGGGVVIIKKISYNVNIKCR